MRPSIQACSLKTANVLIKRRYLLGKPQRLAYRKSSIKRRSAYLIFPVKRAALIRERRLFKSGAYFNWGEYRENSEARTRRAQYNIKCKKKDKYVHLELLYEPGFKSFPTLKL